jgi:hypothetical protein
MAYVDSFPTVNRYSLAADLACDSSLEPLPGFIRDLNASKKGNLFPLTV